MYHTCCSDILCFQSIVSVLLKTNTYHLASKSKSVISVLRCPCSKNYKESEREEKRDMRGRDHRQRKEDGEIGKKEYK